MLLIFGVCGHASIITNGFGLGEEAENNPKTSIKPKTYKEKTDYKLITEPAFLPSTCYG